MYEKSFINIDFPLKRIKTNVLNGHKYQSKMGELILHTPCSGDKIKVLTQLKVPDTKEEPGRSAVAEFQLKNIRLQQRTSPLFKGFQLEFLGFIKIIRRWFVLYQLFPYLCRPKFSI